MEGYIEYLQDILESYNVFFDSEEEYSNKHKIETKKFIEEYSSMVNNYNNQVLEKTDFKKLLS